MAVVGLQEERKVKRVIIEAFFERARLQSFASPIGEAKRRAQQTKVSYEYKNIQEVVYQI